MKRLKTMFVLVAGLAVAATAQGPKEALAAELKKAIPAMEKAFAAEDIRYFQNACTADFTYTDMQGKTEKKAAALAGLKSMFDSSSNIRVKVTARVLRATATAGVISSVQKWNMTTAGPDGKPAKMSMTMTTEETLKKVGARWLVQKIVEKKVADMMMNGKPMGPPPAAAPVKKPNG